MRKPCFSKLSLEKEIALNTITNISQQEYDSTLKIFTKEEEKLMNKYSVYTFDNYIISKIEYQDKYSKRIDILYTADKLLIDNYRYVGVNNYIILPPVFPSDITKLKKCIIENKFDFKSISEMIQQQAPGINGAIFN